jgi:hypothetical protein
MEKEKACVCERGMRTGTRRGCTKFKEERFYFRSRVLLLLLSPTEKTF